MAEADRRPWRGAWLLVLAVVPVGARFALSTDAVEDAGTPEPHDETPAPQFPPPASVDPPPDPAPLPPHKEWVEFPQHPQKGQDPKPRTREPTEKELADYIAKWRLALEPVLSRWSRPQPPAIKVAEAPGKEPPKTCESGPRVLDLLQVHVTDHVVAIDTSGSMWSGGLEVASDFLGRLEFGLASTGRAYRLLVIAEPRHLKLGDAGLVYRRIGSHDALAVLFTVAPGWVNQLRPNSEVRLVLMTDDRPDGNDVRAFAEQLHALMGSRRYAFNIVGGFETSKEAPLAGPQSPVLISTCNRAPVAGLDFGIVYQQLAIATGGFRASLCSAVSRQAMIEALTVLPKDESLCSWNLGPKARPTAVRAVSPRGSEPLVRDYSLMACRNTRRSYLFEGPELALCPDTCAQVKADGYDKLEVEVSCEL